MNKYERARILAERAKQLENGSTPFVDIRGLDDALRIAQKELLEDKIPLSIRRNYGNFELQDEELSGDERLSRENNGDSSECGDESENEDLDGKISSEDESEGGGSSNVSEIE